jgi:hypothetical protein
MSRFVLPEVVACRAKKKAGDPLAADLNFTRLWCGSHVYLEAPHPQAPAGFSPAFIRDTKNI